jgi:dihydrofolate reductase
MGTTQYYTATTLDGYLADRNHSLGWLYQVESDEPHQDRFGRFFARVGAFAMGATTYRWILGHQDVANWRRWYGDTPAWVFTHREQARPPGAEVRFVRGDVRPVHEAMVRAAGDRNIWLVGGGELVGQFADHGLVDELLLDLTPVTLGAGAPLLPRRILSSRLRLVDLERDGQFVHLTYAVGPPSGDPGTPKPPPPGVSTTSTSPSPTSTESAPASSTTDPSTRST